MTALGRGEWHMTNSLSTVIGFFTEFPMPKTRISFAFQSNYVGLGLVCKNYTDLWTSTVWSGDDVAYTSSVAPCMTPERRLIYEVFCLLRTHIILTERINFKKTYVTSIRKLIKTELRWSVLEENIHKSTVTPCENILTTLKVIPPKTAGGVDPSEELDEGELAKLNKMAEYDSDADDEAMVPPVADDPPVDGDGEHDWLPAWEIGRAKLAEMDVIYTRAERGRRLKIKSRIRECILNGIKYLVEDKVAIVIALASDLINHSQQYTRRRRNNLKLV